MSYNQQTADRVRQVLAAQRDVVEVKMIGGLSFMVSGNMCCGVSRDSLMVRVGPHAYQAALSQPHVRPLEFGRMTPVGYVCIDPDGYRTGVQLASWVQQGIDFVTTLPAKKPRPKKTPAKEPRR
jgi:TfoX/Sxy family transcriptional regulator of competence genes